MKNNISVITGKLNNIKRLNSSVNGNPRFELTIDDCTVTTAPDSMIAYSITNYRDKMVKITAKMFYGKLTLLTIE